MVRKWSYINKTTTNLLTKVGGKGVIPKLKLKLFKKSTRFKYTNIHPTLFIRRFTGLSKRRLTFKTYIVLSSFWVKQNLNLRKTTSFSQIKFLHQYTVAYPYAKMFFEKTNLQNLGIGLQAVNLVFLKKSLFFKTNTYNKQLFLPYAQFRKLTTITKLKTLGFFFINLKAENKQVLLYNNLSPILNIITSIRFLHIQYLLITQLKLNKC